MDQAPRQAHLVQPGELIDLREYLAVLRTRKWSVIITIIVLVAIAALYSFRQDPLYTASTRLLISRTNPVTDTTGLAQAPQFVNLITESELIQSEQVAILVVEDLGLEMSAGGALDGLEVATTPQSEVLEISYTASDPQLARDMANSFALSYIEFKQNAAGDSIEIGRESIQARIDRLQRQLDEITAQQEAADDSGSVDLSGALEGQRTQLIAQLAVLEQRLEDFQLARLSDLNVGTVIDVAGLPSEPSSPNHMRNLLLGLLLGLLAGAGIAFLRERLDDRFRSREDVVRIVESPVLAMVPRVAGGRRSKKMAGELVTMTQPRGHASEAYRNLRSGLEFLASKRGFNTLLVTSSSPGEGKTLTTANLGVVLAQAGKRVILVSSDIRRPTLERYFGVQAEEGLAQWLSGPNDDFRGALVDPGIPNMRLLPSGKTPSNPAELISGPKMAQLISDLEQAADFVIFDSPPAAVSDPLILGSQIGGTILVVDANKTTRRSAASARHEIERMGGQIVGVVLNSFDPSSGRQYGYGYGYGYYYSSGNGDKAEEEAMPKSRSLLGIRRG